MLFRNYRIAAIGLLVWSRVCLASTIVAIVAPQGMIIASDSGATIKSEDYTPIRQERAIKFLPVKHLVVAAIGTTDFTEVLQNGTRDVHFVEWITNLEAGLPADVSPETMADKIAAEATLMLAPLDQEIRAGRMKQGNLQEKFKVLTQYMIFGYSLGEPRIYVVQFYIDWDKKEILEPKTFLLHPGPGMRDHSYAFYSFGITQALDDISNTSGYAYQQVVRQCPALADLYAVRDISLDSILNIARAEVRVEERTNPSRVFGEIATIRMLPDGSHGPIETVSPSDKILCRTANVESTGHGSAKTH
jgi:hypothetical protein